MILIIILIIIMVVALIPAFIAKNKGGSFGLWWLYGFLLFPIALIHSLIMKPSTPLGMKKCSSCAEYVKDEALVCRYCGNSLQPVATPYVAKKEVTNQRTKKFLLVLLCSLLLMVVLAALSMSSKNPIMVGQQVKAAQTK